MSQVAPYTADPIPRGGDYSLSLYLTNRISAPPALTNVTVKVRSTPDSGAVLWTGAAGSGLTVTNAADSAEVKVIIPKASTAVFPVGDVWLDLSCDGYDVTAGASIHLAGLFQARIPVIEVVSR